MPPMRRPAENSSQAMVSTSYSLTHLARRWKRSRREIRKMLQCGDLPFEQINGQLRVPRQAVYKLEKRWKKDRVTE